MKTITEFIEVYLMYRRVHERAYSLRMAYNVAVRGLPF